MASEGLTLVGEGELVKGMRLLDEAAAAAIASGSDDFAAVGHTCCAMLAACEIAGDIERAGTWSERTTEYARRYGFRPLRATCRTSYAAVLISAGRWPEAEAELSRAGDEFAAVRPAARSQALVRLADLRRRQGRFAEAAELFAEAEGHSAAVLGRAALAHDQGDPDRACDLAERYLRNTPDSNRAERAVALELVITTRAARSQLDAAEEALEELRSIAAFAPTESLEALAASATGAVAAARGEQDCARRSFEDAVDRFNRCGAPFEAARARLELARALRECGKPLGAAEEAQAARDAFARLGAGHELERAARFLIGLDGGGATEAATLVETDLTPREREVLALIATGLTNREIATRLVISEHTAHRHTTNVYRKLGVSSRATATAYAHRRGLA